MQYDICLIFLVKNPVIHWVFVIIQDGFVLKPLPEHCYSYYACKIP